MLGIYERIETLSKERKVSQKELAEAIGLSSGQIFTNWKARNSMLGADVAVKIAHYFGVTVEYLVTGETSNPLQQSSEELGIKYYELLHKYEALKKSVIKAVEDN